jgi:diacylglycerol kinase (ATP)
MIAILINGISRRLKDVMNEVEKVFPEHLQYGLFESQYAGHLRGLATEVVKKGYTHFICVGGDGTLNEVVNGLVSAFEYANCSADDPLETRYDWAGLTRLRVALYPAGTGNDFARTIKAKPDLKQILQLIEADSYCLTDIGYARFMNPELSGETARFCINIADVGMGGDVALHLSKDSRLRQISPKLLYQREVIRAFFSYQKKPVRCYNEQFAWEGLATAIVAANGNYFGGGIGVAPQADCTSGKLGITIVGNVSLWDYATRLPTLMRCKKAQHPEISYHNFEKICVESLAEQMPIDMDGEFVGYTPFMMQKLRQRLPILQHKA